MNRKFNIEDNFFFRRKFTELLRMNVGTLAGRLLNYLETLMVVTSRHQALASVDKALHVFRMWSFKYFDKGA